MPPSPPNPSAVSRYGASAGDTIARKTRPQCIEDIDARPTAFLVAALQRDKVLPVTPSRLKPLLQEQWRCACMAVVVHLHDLRQAACSTRDHAQRTPRDSAATCCGGPYRKVSLRLRRTAAVAACPVRAETASTATITINASRLKPLPQESEVVRCRCHVGRMDSRRSGTCRCSGSAATFGLQRVAAEAVPTERATPHDAGAMSSPWIRAEAACAAALDQRRPCASHASRLHDS